MLSDSSAAQRSPDTDAPGREVAFLVSRSQLGDLRALDQLLTAIQGPLFRHIRFIVGSDDSGAEDVLQDVLLAVSRKLGDLRDPKWFRAWTFRIATRLAVHHARRNRRLAERMESLDLRDVPSEEADAEFDSDLAAGLLAALSAAPPASQLVLRMHYLEGLTYVEIAEALEISVGTVKSRLNYGLSWLRKMMPQE